jgi:hypothetical protein
VLVCLRTHQTYDPTWLQPESFAAVPEEHGGEDSFSESLNSIRRPGTTGGID